MSQPELMNLKILLPFGVYAEKAGVRRIVAEARQGFFGILPHRLDCAAGLVPGILVYENDEEGESYIAIDEGILVKTGFDVTVSVRKAIAGKELNVLREAVENEFVNLNEQEAGVRSTMAKLETGLIRKLAELRHD